MVVSNPITKVVGIYKITSPTGRVYIGQSWDIDRRWRYHRYDHRLDYGIQRSIKKHGVDTHTFEVIHALPPDASQDDLNYWERFYIREVRESKVGCLNFTEGGSNGRPVEGVLQKMRGPKSATHRANIAKAVKRQWAEGKKRATPVTEEMKEKIRATMTGRKYSAERVAKASNWIRTPEIRERISKTLQGRSASTKLTPERVLEIRAKYIPRVYSVRRLAAEYGVDNRTIRAVINRVTWQHV